MTAIPLMGLVGQWHMLSSLETITQQETLILTMMSIGPSDHQVGQGGRAAAKLRGYRGLASATPSSWAWRSQHLLLVPPSALLAKWQQPELRSFYVPERIGGVTVFFPIISGAAELPITHPQSTSLLEGHRLGVWLLELLDGDRIL